MASVKKTRQKSTSVEEASSPARRSAIVRLLRFFWRPIPLLVTAVSMSGVMFWPEIAERLPDLQQRREYQLSWSELVVTPPAQGVPVDLVAQVQQLSGLPDPLPVLEAELAEQLSVAFSRHPWVASVESVTKSGPQTVRIELTYREPVLIVRTPRGYYPVDRDAVLLPPSDFAAADIERFPLVERVQSEPAGPAGTAWGDHAVLGAARLSELLIRKEQWTSAWEKFGMSSIQVLLPGQAAATLEEVTLGIKTDAGSQIVWGRPPGADSLEPTVEQKLLRLEKYLPEYGEPAWNNAPVQLDIRQWDVIQQHELSRGGGASRPWR